jgi:hypothetical protein
MLAGRRATTVRIRKKLGKQSIISTNRIIRVSSEMVSERRKCIQGRDDFMAVATTILRL